MMLRKRFMLRVFLVAAFLALSLVQAVQPVQAAGGVIIDDFSTKDQSLLVWPDFPPEGPYLFPSPASSTSDAPADGDILGGYRKLDLANPSGTGLLIVSSIAADSNIELLPGSNATGTLAITWDGNEPTLKDLHGTGLADRFFVHVERATAGISLTIEVRDNVTTGQSTITLPEIDTAEALPLLFTSFSNQASIDWNSIVSVKLILDTSLAPGAYAMIGLVETSDSTPTAVKQLSLSGAGNSIQILVGTAVAAGALVVARGKRRHEN